MAALLAELAGRAPAFAGLALETVYFGGGTPALLAPDSIERLLGAVRKAFPGAPREVTLEANPSTLERGRLTAFRSAGVDRLSLGVQSFDDGTLRRLGRAHRARESRARARSRARGRLREPLARPDRRRAGPVARWRGARPRRGARRGARARLRLRAHARAGYAVRAGGRRGEARRPRRGPRGGDARSRRRSGSRAPASSATRSRASRGPAARRSTTSATGGAGPCSGSAWARTRRSRARPRRPSARGARTSASSRHGSRGSRLDARSRPCARCRMRRPRAARRRSSRSARAKVSAPTSFAAEFGATPRHFFAAAIDELLAAGLLVERATGDLAPSRHGFAFADLLAARFVSPPS